MSKLVCVNFIYEGQTLKIQCTKEEYMKTIIEKFASKIQKNINEIYFLYNGNILNSELKLEDINNKDNEISIMVYDSLVNKNQSSLKDKVVRSKKNIPYLKMVFCPSFQASCYGSGWGGLEQSATLFVFRNFSSLQNSISNYNRYVTMNNVIEDILDKIEDPKITINEIGPLSSLAKKLNDKLKNINPIIELKSYFQSSGRHVDWIGNSGGYNRGVNDWNSFAQRWNNKISNKTELKKRDDHISFLYETFGKNK